MYPRILFNLIPNAEIVPRRAIRPTSASCRHVARACDDTIPAICHWQRMEVVSTRILRSGPMAAIAWEKECLYGSRDGI